jgi:hypothetical protein
LCVASNWYSAILNSDGDCAGNVDVGGADADDAQVHSFCVSSLSPFSAPSEFCVACGHAGCEEDYDGAGCWSECGLHRAQEG